MPNKLFEKNTGTSHVAESKKDYTYYWQLWHHNWDDLDAALIKSSCSLPNKRVLEVGCGDGRITLALSGECSAIVGVDLSDKLIAQAQKRIQDGATNIEFQVMDAERLTFADESFDVILFPWVLQMVSDSARALSEAHRVLKPGGRLMVIGLLSHADYDDLIAKFVPNASSFPQTDPRTCYEKPLQDLFRIDVERHRSQRTFDYFFETLDIACDAFSFALKNWYGGIELDASGQERLKNELQKYQCSERIRLRFPANVYLVDKSNRD